MLDLSFNIDEVFEIAGQIEKNGAAFYRKAAELTDIEIVCDLFLDLAVQEDDHARIFSGIRESLVPDVARMSVYDKDDIVALHLHALANREVFNVQQEPSALLTGKESAEDVIRMAIGKEWDSILFYAAIRDLMTEEEDRVKTDSIIRQEYRHVDQLKARLD